MSSVSNLTAVRALISALPRKELQALDKEIRGLIEASPKKTRVAAVGQKAWFAFMRHCRDTMADRFTACKSAPDYAVVCKAIRQEDEAVYTAFVEKFKAENSAPPSEAEVSPAPPSEASVPVAKPSAKAKLSAEEKEVAKVAKALEKEQKAVAKSAEKEAKSATKSAEKEQKAADKEAAKAAKAAEKAADKLQKALEKQQKLADKEAAKEAAKAAKLAAKPAKAKPAKAKPAAKKATATAPISAEATPAPAEAEEDAMPKITIAGTAYWHDESTNGLYSIDAAGGFGDWVGYYQPDNEEEPIRYTATPE